MTLEFKPDALTAIDSGIDCTEKRDPPLLPKYVHQISASRRTVSG